LPRRASDKADWHRNAQKNAIKRYKKSIRIEFLGSECKEGARLFGRMFLQPKGYCSSWQKSAFSITLSFVWTKQQRTFPWTPM
jgi:hypothetical protein